MNDVSPRQAVVLNEAANWYILLREEPDDADLRHRFSQWAKDANNAEAWSAMGYTVAAIERVPPALRAQLKDQVAPTTGPRQRRRGARRSSAKPSLRVRRRTALATAIAASITVLVAPSVWLRATTDVLTGSGQIKTVRLPDGSTATLGPNSAIRLDFANGHRNVELAAGQAFFDVRHDPVHPFEVETGDVRTTVLGTAFDVRRLGESTRVGVNRGSVRVRSKTAQAVLAAGNWAEIDRDEAMARGQQAPDLAGAWQAGKAFVRNRTIAEVIEEIRPWQNGRILLMDERLGTQRVTGIYDVSDPASALALLVNPYGGRIIQVTPWLLIVTS